MIDNISWLSIYPEIVLFIMGCVICLVAVHGPSHQTHWVRVAVQ